MYGAFGSYLERTRQRVDWPQGIWRLSDALSIEVLNTLAVVANVCDDKFNGFGFAIVDLEELDGDRSANFAVPLCANLNRCAVVFWLESDGTYLLKDGLIAGVRLDRILGIEIELRKNKFGEKATKFPELVVDARWPALQLGPQPRQTSSDTKKWGIRLIPA